MSNAFPETHGGTDKPVLLSISIKAYNEQANIARAIESAMRAAAGFDAEVILSDSRSVDHTIEIAKRYPIRIVQLSEGSDRSCGAGAQLAFQQAKGKYFYLMDADMELDAGFVAAAIAHLEGDLKLAGVGGRLIERHAVGAQFKILAKSMETRREWLPGEVNRLDGGGLYRASAIHDVGYFADRNLHAFEEHELAARLRARGWKLARIDQHAVDHFGNQINSYKLLWRRIKSGYAAAAGEVLRCGIGQPHLSIILQDMPHIRYGMAVIAWWLLLLATLLVPLLGFWRLLVTLGVLAAPILFLAARRGSLALGLYSLAAWNVSAWGLISGVFKRRVSPQIPVPGTVLS